MAIHRDRPYGQSNFFVDFGDGAAESAAAGFSEVIFPAFDAHPDEGRETATAGERAIPLLILKRGFTGSLDLYTWWAKARRGRAPKRKTLHIRLLAENHETVVAAWRFRAVHPVRLSYSPLRANEGGIVIETVELAFDKGDAVTPQFT
jgi:phage tail-like protein